MDKAAFLSKASETTSFISESKILSQLAKLNKAVIICVDKLEHFEKYFSQLKDKIESLRMSQLNIIRVNNDGSFIIEDCGSRTINEAAIMNMVNEKFSAYEGYCFVVDSGLQYLYSCGKINEEVNNCLQKTKSMQDKLDVLKPVAELKEVFAHFLIECTYRKDKYYHKFFDSDTGKVKAEIKEQELRNLLREYLNKKMRGEVGVEFCTDYYNDEESVDIYINDGMERAIIEVKFSLPKKYYLGASNYPFSTRIHAGIIQLDKYAKHLAKDSRLVDYGYIYMFYMNDCDEAVMQREADNKYEEVYDIITNELKSIFSGIQLNDMKSWRPILN